MGICATWVGQGNIYYKGRRNILGQAVHTRSGKKKTKGDQLAFKQGNDTVELQVGRMMELLMRLKKYPANDFGFV
jgi:hypothetical protein